MTDAHAGGNEGHGLVSASEIAKIAGVKPSAVSNWRKRFVDFPRPAGTAPSGGDLFRMVDVEGWLRSRDRSHKPARDATQQLWAVAEQLRGRALAGDIVGLVAVGAAFVHLARESGEQIQHQLRANANEVVEWVRTTVPRIEADGPKLAGLFGPLLEIDPQSLRLLLDTLDDLETREQLAAAVDGILARGTRYGEFLTPPAVAGFVAELADPHGVVFDPAAGSSELLLRAAAATSRRHIVLYGQEMNIDTWRLAMARLLLHDLPGELAHGDSLMDDAFPYLRADVVLSEPPAGARPKHTKELRGDPRWQLLGMLDSPPPRAADFAWLAHAIDHLAADGRGYVLLPTGSLFRGGVEARMRSELLRQGTVEAVVTLPSGAPHHAMAASALWIVREPTSTPDPVLLVNGHDETGTLSPEFRARIIDTVRTWRSRRTTFKPTAGFATSVSVLELLAGDAALVPSRWLYEPELVDTDAILGAVHDAQLRLEAARKKMPALPPHFELRPTGEPPPRLRVRDLVDHGLARLIRPSRLKSGDYIDEGLPVWLPGDVRAPWQRDEPPKFADPAQVDPRSITEPGDIVFTTIGGIRTRVDTEGGHVLGTSLQALRLEPETFEPTAVAALLTSEPNRRLVSGTIPRVNVLELEIPRLDLAEATRVADVLEALEGEEELGYTIARRAAGVREALIAALATGAGTLLASSQRPDD